MPVAPLGPTRLVELFLARARAARPGFEPDAEEVALAAEIVRRVDGLPLAIELAAARVHVLGSRRARLHPRAPRGAPARHARRPIRAAPHCKGWSSGATTSCTGTRRRCSNSSQSTAAARPSPSLVAVAATHEPQRGDSRVSAFRRWSTSRSCRPRSPRRRRALRHARHGPRVRARASCRERRARRSARRPRRVLRGARRTTRAAGLRGPEWLRVGDADWSSRTTISGPRSRTRRTRPTLPSRFGSERSGGTSRSPSVFPRDGASSSSALSATGDDAPLELRVELLAGLCYLATEELDHDAALEAGRTRASRSPRPPRRHGSWDSRGSRSRSPLAQSGDVERADELAGGAAATFEAAGDDWGVAASSLIRAIGCGASRRRLIGRRDGGGDPPLIRTRSATTRFASPALLLEAWVAERRQDGAAAVEAYRRALDARGTHRVRRPRGVRPHGARGERAREGRPARGGGAPAAGARRPPRRPMRHWSRRMRASSSARIAAASGDAAGAEQPYRRGRSSGRSCSGRTRRARASSSRSPAARPRQRCSGWPAAAHPRDRRRPA